MARKPTCNTSCNRRGRSPWELPARNQLAQRYESMDRGRRFKPVLTPATSASQLREWAAILADAWKLFVSGLFAEAEPVYRKMLALNPRDAVATHQLGVTLMELGRCEDALAVFDNMSNLDPSEEDFADTTFWMGQCYVELERWDEAFVHVQTLYDAAVEFEESNKDVAIPAGTRVLGKEKLARWLDRVRPHVPELAQFAADQAQAEYRSGVATGEPSDEELSVKAVDRMTPQNTLDAGGGAYGQRRRCQLVSVHHSGEEDRRGDYPTGAHEFIPLHPGDSFTPHSGDLSGIRAGGLL